MSVCNSLEAPKTKRRCVQTAEFYIAKEKHPYLLSEKFPILPLVLRLSHKVLASTIQKSEKARNDLVFNGIRKKPGDIVEEIKIISYLWASNRSKELKIKCNKFYSRSGLWMDRTLTLASFGIRNNVCFETQDECGLE
ncbi:hypothetical protein QVD17_16933 [Tagetes erecta]|uniref:Uncharacterized protein n=1 Tax=Tagetes erecta TaxID=13708 RepID=A0AAD8KRG8_TARER|nr:hypothetical protein QVD17_16933 [Tagetes erecta]